MIHVEVILLPTDLQPRHLQEKAVVVFDVLRATTSITAALAAGVSEIRVFGDATSAARAAAAHGEGRLLCGETNCLPPPGFDLGNSPGAFQRDLHAARTMYLSTTNGTRAIIAARGAAMMLAGALVNAAAVAGQLAEAGRDVTLLCAGTGGDVAMEDVLGAGAVFSALQEIAPAESASDTARIALRLFQAERSRLVDALLESGGGRNVIAAGLEEDIVFAAALNSIDVVGVVRDEPLRVVSDLSSCPN